MNITSFNITQFTDIYSSERFTLIIIYRIFQFVPLNQKSIQQKQRSTWLAPGQNIRQYMFFNQYYGRKIQFRLIECKHQTLQCSPQYLHRVHVKQTSKHIIPNFSSVPCSLIFSLHFTIRILV